MHFFSLCLDPLNKDNGLILETNYQRHKMKHFLSYPVAPREDYSLLFSHSNASGLSTLKSYLSGS